MIGGLSLLISLDIGEILPKIRHVGTDYDDIKQFHCWDQRKSKEIKQTAGT